MASQELDEVRPLRRRRTWYLRRDVLFVAFVAVLWLAAEGYGRLTGPSRMTEALAAALEQKPASLDLVVTAKFPPERFHSNIYNEIGVQRGTEGASTLLVRVKPANVRWIARQYWIERVDLAPQK